MMPLPTGGQPWPPRELDLVTARLDVWSAWYSGDPDRLSLLYGGTLGGDPGRPIGSPDVDMRGWRGWLTRLKQRWFWGTQTPANESRTKLHLPLAGDIAETSAALLFGEPPSFTVDDKATQARIDEFVEDGLHADLLEAAEVCAGLGGVYLRVCWAREVRDRPWLSAVHPDCAIPEWRYGRLRAVTFWQVVARDGNEVWRHLERHEPGDGDATAVILHGLYKGSDRDLGKPQPLTARPETTGLPPRVDTGIRDGIAAVYVPNMRPSRVWRDVPEGAHLGRADIAGTEGLMDSLDEVYSSLMRDIRLAKGRLIIPESFLQSQGQGQGAVWDSEQELIYPVAALLRPDAQGGMPLLAQQFDIRVQEHLDAAQELQDKIVRSAGYAAQTFGAAGDVAVTATEVAARERRSLTTRDRKITYWLPALAQAMHALLQVDVHEFKSKVKPDRPMVEFPDAVSEEPSALAQTAQLLRAAEAASTETLVRMVHPDWEKEDVDAEVKRIEDEAPAPEIVPGSGVGMGPAGPGTPGEDDDEDRPDGPPPARKREASER